MLKTSLKPNFSELFWVEMNIPMIRFDRELITNPEVVSKVARNIRNAVQLLDSPRDHASPRSHFSAHFFFSSPAFRWRIKHDKESKRAKMSRSGDTLSDECEYLLEIVLCDSNQRSSENVTVAREAIFESRMPLAGFIVQ